MLMFRPRSNYIPVEATNVHNYYERIVEETIATSTAREPKDPDFVADVTCVALNHLPPRYIRHDVDMNFFMSPAEREEISKKVQHAVDYAMAFVIEHQKEKQKLPEPEEAKEEPKEE